MLGIYELLYAMYMSQYTYVLRSVEEMEKKCFQAYRASKGGATAITEHYANGYCASQSGVTSLSRRSRWRDKPVVLPRPT